MKRLLVICAAAGALVLWACVSVAPASTSVTPFGNATVNPDGSVALVSDTHAATAYAGIDLPVPSGLTVNGLTHLSADYNVTNDDCAGGSPRFQLSVDGKSVFVFIGPLPSFTGCAGGWQSTGDLITSADGRFDLTQFGGPYYGHWSDVQALLGAHTITDIRLVVDSGWAFPDGEQTVIVRNVEANTTSYVSQVARPASKAECKKGGWRRFDNPSFRNQGQCVSYVNHSRSKGSDDEHHHKSKSAHGHGKHDEKD